MNQTQQGPSRFSLGHPSRYLVTLLLGASLLSAAAKPAKVFSELSVAAKESYDNNVYATSFNQTGFKPVADVYSYVTTVSVKATAELSSVLGLPSEGPLTSFGLAYSGDYSYYHNASSENNERHNLTVSLKAKEGAWSSNLENMVTFVDGSSSTVQFKTNSSFATALVRERRKQIQDRLKYSTKYDAEQWFFRPTGQVLYYDLMTDKHQATGNYVGWQNYVDRYDMNIGADFGYKLRKDLALVAGYRFGSQSQDSYSWDARHNDSTYHRVLFGIEGKLAPWIKVEFLAGPDYRKYKDAKNLGLTGDRHTFAYTEGNLTAELSATDSITVTNKVWHWVASTGLTAYRDSLYGISFKHKFNSKLSSVFGAKLQTSLYDAPAVRKDWLYTFSAGARYDLDKNTSFNFEYQIGRDRNRLDEYLAPGRDYNQDIVSAGFKYTF